MRLSRIAIAACVLLASPVDLLAQVQTGDTSMAAGSWADDGGQDGANCGCDACDCTCYDPCCGRYLYVSAIAGVSFASGQSGGLNEGGGAGGFENTGSTSDSLFLAGAAIGLAIPREYGTLRLEFEGRARNEMHGETNSFMPPFPTFFFDVAVTDGWTTMFNAWYDVQLRNRVAVYGGGGVGVGGYNLSVSDTVVNGSESTADFCWQLGGGVIYQINDRIELDFGYRYVNLGTSNIPLFEDISGDAAGNYRLDLTSSDLLLQVRISEPFSMLRR